MRDPDVHERLRAIRGTLGRIEERLDDVTSRLGRLEVAVSHVQVAVAK